MGYRERTGEEIRSIGQRTDERLALWQTVVDSFEEGGADAVQERLSGHMGEIRRRFDELLARLEGML